MKKLNWREFDSCVYITVLLDVLVNFVRSTIKNYPDKLFPKQPNVNILSITYTRVSRLLNYANSYCTFNFRLSCLNNLLSIAFCVRYFK